MGRISLGIIFANIFYIPLALSIPLAIAAFILLNIYFRKKIVRRMSIRFNSRPAGDFSYSSSLSMIELFL
jgi:hypothetical protein